METKNLYPTLVASVLAFGMFCGGLVQCSSINRKALLQCIEKTQKPLECRHAMPDGL